MRSAQRSRYKVATRTAIHLWLEMKYAVVFVVAAVLLPGLQALGLDSQSEDDMLDGWLDELRTVDRQSLEEVWVF